MKMKKNRIKLKRKEKKRKRSRRYTAERGREGAVESGEDIRDRSD
jgi:hypothetical protein